MRDVSDSSREKIKRKHIHKNILLPIICTLLIVLNVTKTSVSLIPMHSPVRFTDVHVCVCVCYVFPLVQAHCSCKNKNTMSRWKPSYLESHARHPISKLQHGVKQSVSGKWSRWAFILLMRTLSSRPLKYLIVHAEIGGKEHVRSPSGMYPALANAKRINQML